MWKLFQLINKQPVVWYIESGTIFVHKRAFRNLEGKFNIEFEFTVSYSLVT